MSFGRRTIEWFWTRLQSPLTPPPSGRSILVTTVAASLAVVVLLSALGISQSTSEPLLSVRLSVSNLQYTSNGSLDLRLFAQNAGSSAVTATPILGSNLGAPIFGSFALNPIPPGTTSVANLSAPPVARFNGVNTSVVISNSTGFNSPNFSVEVDFEYSSFLPDQQELFEKGAGQSSAIFFYSYRSVNNINDFAVLSNGTRSNYQLGDIFQVDRWYDLGFSVSADNVTAFVNGGLVETWPRTGPTYTGNNQPLVIGNCGCGGYFFNGSVSFVRYYSQPLTAAQFAHNFQDPSEPATTNLSSWLCFSETALGRVPDCSGNGHSGSASGPLTLVPVISPGSAVIVGVSCVVDGFPTVNLLITVRAPALGPQLDME